MVDYNEQDCLQSRTTESQRPVSVNYHGHLHRFWNNAHFIEKIDTVENLFIEMIVMAYIVL